MVFDTFIVAFIAKAASLIACGLSLIPPGGGKANIGVHSFMTDGVEVF